jgi:hypothetical protein
MAGERTGKFRPGIGELLTTAGGKNWISIKDFAVALADEIERPASYPPAFHGCRQGPPDAARGAVPVQGPWLSP